MHLHIGQNNVIGRAMQRLGLCDVVSYTEFLLMSKYQIQNYSKISISAFNPVLKKRNLLSADNLSSFLVESARRDSHVIYINTARALDEKVAIRHKSYINNKKLISNYLKENFINFSCLYIPNIVPQVSKDQCAFIDVFLKNLESGLVRFDCDVESNWNFICSNALAYFIEAISRTYGEVLIINEKNLYVRDLLSYAKD